MNYYKHNIGDYRRDTYHLNMTEHGIYRQLLDQYYLDEKPIPLDLKKLMRLIRINTPYEQTALENVLSDFFIETQDGYEHKRCERDLSEIYHKSEKARNSAKCRWDKEKIKDEMRTHSDCNANGMLPITHYPLPTIKPKSKNKFSDDDMKLAQWMFSEIQRDIPNAKTPNFESWANTFRLMRERDKRELRDIAETIRWSRQDNFWSTNILSPSKLREQYDKLTAKRTRRNETYQRNGKPTGCDIIEANDRAAAEWLELDEGTQTEDGRIMERIINPV